MPFLFLFTFGIAYSDRLKSNKPFENINLWLLIIPIYMGLILMLPAHYYNSRFFYAPAMFVVLHYLWHKFEAVKSAKLLLTFGKLSLWIYLVHFSVESLFVNLLPYDFNYSVFVYILLITILTTAASGVVAKLFENVYFQFLGLVKKKPLHSLFVKGD
jgi:peptidoglycan/LPS O-acetylase OafA/YrhL